MNSQRDGSENEDCKVKWLKMPSLFATLNSDLSNNLFASLNTFHLNIKSFSCNFRWFDFLTQESFLLLNVSFLSSEDQKIYLMCNVRFEIELSWLSVGLFMTKAETSSFWKHFSSKIEVLQASFLGEFNVVMSVVWWTLCEK